MVTNCDICGDKISPIESLDDEDEEYETLTLNGKTLDLCLDCYLAVSDWAVSDEAKTYCAKHKKEQEQ